MMEMREHEVTSHSGAVLGAADTPAEVARAESMGMAGARLLAPPEK